MLTAFRAERTTDGAVATWKAGMLVYPTSVAELTRRNSAFRVEGFCVLAHFNLLWRD